MWMFLISDCLCLLLCVANLELLVGNIEVMPLGSFVVVRCYAFMLHLSYNLYERCNMQVCIIVSV